MRRSKPYYGSIGSISTGTLRTEDLWEAFLYECKSLRLQRSERNAIRKIEANRAVDATQEEVIEQMEYEVEEMQDILNNHAPAYMYFGAHLGDGADFGFWLSEESLQSTFDGLTVKDTSEVPKGFTGEVLHVNDHGNTTLYSANKGRLREVWAVV